MTDERAPDPATTESADTSEDLPADGDLPDDVRTGDPDGDPDEPTGGSA